MRQLPWTRWIWFVGCAAWVLDAVISVHLQNAANAKLAMTIAFVFAIAGVFYNAQKR